MGYQIRFVNNTNDRTKLIFCTTAFSTGEGYADLCVFLHMWMMLLYV